MRLIDKTASKFPGFKIRSVRFLVQFSFVLLAIVPGNMRSTQILEYPRLPGPILNPLMGGRMY